MVIRLNNLDKWFQLEAGHSIQLQGDGERKLRIEFNMEHHASVSMLADGKYTFLAAFQGLETLEFYANAPEIEVTSDGQVWFFTTDGDPMGVENPDAVNFTKPMGMRTRSDQLEIMIRRQAENYERRLYQQAEEYNAYIAANGGVEHNPATGELSEPEVSSATDGGNPPAPAVAPALVDATPPKGAEPVT